METEDTNVLETARVREVFGTFDTAAELEAAIQDLLIGGFDRADIDLMASAEAVKGKLSATFVERTGGVEFSDFRTPDDNVNSTALVAGALAYIGAVGAAVAVVASGGSLALAGAAALAGGAGGGGLGTLLRRKLGPAVAGDLVDRIAAGELTLWVRVRDRDHERRAADILKAHQAQHVDVVEIELEKRVADLPLATFRPDPWLSEEPLGHIPREREKS